MATNPRYPRPVDNARPFKSHRYDVFGLKVQRRLTLFGELALVGFILLEADPDITSYCERPIVIEEIKPRRVVDFWVQRRNSEELWFLLRPSELKWLERENAPTTAFRVWAESKGLDVHLIALNAMSLSDARIRNWGEIIRWLSANLRHVDKLLIQKVIELCCNNVSIQAVEGALSSEDPILVRTAIFRLVHQGRLRLNDINASLIGSDTIVEPV